MANKEASVAELTELFQSSTAVLLTEYRGLTVAQLKQLRSSIREDASYAVVKNTLTKIAANNAGISSFDDELAGPSAIAFVHGDPSPSRRPCVTSPRQTLFSWSRAATSMAPR